MITISLLWAFICSITVNDNEKHTIVETRNSLATHIKHYHAASVLLTATSTVAFTQRLKE